MFNYYCATRKIEKRMLKAIENKKGFFENNTQVIIKGDIANVYLFGNNIGYYSYTAGLFIVNKDMLRIWPTPTTKSRLRAFDVNVRQSKNKIYLDDKYLCDVI